jgi:transposase
MRPSSARRRSAAGAARTWPGGPVTARRRHQVTDIAPAPAPKITEYVAQARECAGSGTLTEGELPAHVRARASYGPETCAQAASLVSGHHIPIYRATLLLCQLAGLAVSAGWMAGIRGKAAALVEASGFTGRVRALLKAAPAVHADETPARTAGGTRYVHLACTRYLTHMHTGNRSAEAIDAGGVLPGYEGVIVRDGYAGYGHLTSALHAWCAAVHLLRDLKGLYDFEPARQDRAARLASLLIEARDAAAAARQGRAVRPGHSHPGRPGHPLPGTGHRGPGRQSLPAHRRREGRPPPRPPVPPLRGHDPAVRHPPDLDIFPNNEAERTIRPAKVLQRSSGGCWRTLTGLTEFALVQSYLSTAAK